MEMETAAVAGARPSIPALIDILPDRKFVHFEATSDGDLKASINLQNLTDKWVMFKIKTSSPSMCVVRPHLEALEPGITRRVSFAIRKASVPEFREELRFQDYYNSLPEDQKGNLSSSDKRRVSTFVLQYFELTSANLEELLPVRIPIAGGIVDEAGVAACAAIIRRIWQEREAGEKSNRDQVGSNMLSMRLRLRIKFDGDLALLSSLAMTAASSSAANDDPAPRNVVSSSPSASNTNNNNYQQQQQQQQQQDPAAGAGSEQGAGATGGAGIPLTRNDRVSAVSAAPTQQQQQRRYSTKGNSNDPSTAAAAAVAAANATAAAERARIAETMQQMQQLRDEYNNVIGMLAQITSERDALGQAVTKRENTIASIREQLQTATAAAAAASSSSAASGLRNRKPASTDGVGQDGTNATAVDEADLGMNGGRGQGFALWQVIVLAFLMFLLGRVSVSIV